MALNENFTRTTITKLGEATFDCRSDALFTVYLRLQCRYSDSWLLIAALWIHVKSDENWTLDESIHADVMAPACLLGHLIPPGHR